VTSDGFGAVQRAAPPAGFLPALRRNSASLREASLRLGGTNRCPTSRLLCP